MLGRLVVAQATTDAIVDNALRLQLANDLDQLFALFFVDSLEGIKPHYTDGSIVGQQLSNLWFEFAFKIFLEILLIFVGEIDQVTAPTNPTAGTGWYIRIFPVSTERVINAKSDSMFLASLGKLFDRISFEHGALHDVV